MLSEYFCSGGRKQLFLAWAGLVGFVGHAIFKAVIKVLLNDWYRRFYDLVQTSNSATDPGAQPLEHAALSDGRQKINDMLFRFVVIVAPGLVVHPVAKYLVSVWTYTWRVALVRAYLQRWNPLTLPVEGAAQRVHEDTLRFVDGIYSCVAAVLDSTLTLVVFTPVLLQLGHSVHPPWSDPYATEDTDGTDGWLVLVAVAGAVGGLAVSACVGRHLVTLEVQNQRVEAQLRTKLVLLAETPDAVLGRPAARVEDGADRAHSAERAEEHPDDDIPADGASMHARTRTRAHTQDDSRYRRASSPSPVPMAPADAFMSTLRDLWSNYSRLFRRFVYMNAWLALFDQTFVLLPYLLCAPLLFAEQPAHRITLGTLVQVSNAFGRVFDSLAVVSESWTAINSWRSVLRRLLEFETQLYGGRGFRGSLLARTAAAAVDLPLGAARPSATPRSPRPPSRFHHGGRRPVHYEDDDVVTEAL